MKYKIATFLLLGLSLILGIGYLHTKYRLSKALKQEKVIGKTDTIYISKPFKYQKEYKTQVLPNYVFFYGNIWKDSTTVALNPDTITKKDSIVQILLSKQDLSISFFNTDLMAFSKKDFKIDLSNFNYNWVNGQLTQKKIRFKPELHPYVYTKFRPFHKLTDIGLGLSLKTPNLQYKLGFNGYYYPCLNDKFGLDLEFSITYNLE